MHGQGGALAFGMLTSRTEGYTMSEIPTFSADDLRSRISGNVLLPGQEGFDEARRGFNLAREHSPDLIVAAHTAQDVAAAVSHAAAHNLPVQVHSTGHGIGTPASNGLLVTTSAMDSVSVDPQRRTATVGAGARWHQVISAATEHGLAPLNGSSPTVGVIGYTLGGGMGPMGRTFGFAADRVRRAQIVTATGEVLEVDAASDPELFWALCGGKSSVGIVTQLEFDLVEVADVHGGGLFFPGACAPAVLHAFREWAPALPHASTTSVSILRLPDLEFVPPPLRGQMVVHLRFVHIGSDAEGTELLAPMRASAPAMMDSIGRMPYAAIGSVHQDPEDPMPAWDGSLLLDQLPAEAIDALLSVAGPGQDIPILAAELRLMGGAFSSEQGSPNAVGGRDAAFSFYVVGPYMPPIQAAVEAVGAGILTAMAPWGNGRTQANFAGGHTAAANDGRFWPEPIRDRLVALKQERDPAGRFSFGVSPT